MINKIGRMITDKIKGQKPFRSNLSFRSYSFCEVIVLFPATSSSCCIRCKVGNCCNLTREIRARQLGTSNLNHYCMLPLSILEEGWLRWFILNSVNFIYFEYSNIMSESKYYLQIPLSKICWLIGWNWKIRALYL